MSVVQNGIRNEIKELKASKLDTNSAISVLSKLSSQAKELAETNVQKANETASVDERIQYLVSALQGVLNLVEDASENIRDDVGKIELQIQTLQDILQKITALEEEEKKSNRTSDDE